MRLSVTLLTIAVIIMVATFGTSFAQTSTDLQESAYGTTIDNKIAFYQKRIHLVESDYEILSDLGRDAVQKVSFLKSYRKQLITNMVAKNVKLDPSKMNSFLGTKINNIGTTLEAYSTE